MTLEASYQLAQTITKDRAKNFYYGIRLLPKEKRDSLCAVYAFYLVLHIPDPVLKVRTTY